MRKKILLMLAAISTLSVSAQKSEVGVFVGTSWYLGELNPSAVFAQPKLAFGALYRYNVSDHFSFRGNVYYGNIHGYDSLSTDKEQKTRNLSFKSVVLEVGAGFEINFLRFEAGNTAYPLTPYIFAGIAIYKFNPKAEFEGSEYALQPLGTEGQGTTAYPDRKKYSLTQLSLPFGVGVKFNISKSIGFGLEWGMRYTFTDYLDDVSSTYADPLMFEAEYGPVSAALSDKSIQDDPDNPVSNVNRQRGNSQNNDWYSFAGATITFRIPNKAANCYAY